MILLSNHSGISLYNSFYLLIMVFFFVGCEEISDSPVENNDKKGPLVIKLSKLNDLEPGEEIALEIMGDTLSPNELAFWVNSGTDNEIIIPLKMTCKRDIMDIPNPSLHFLPVLHSGTHQIQVGSATEPLSNALEINVVQANTRYNQTEVAIIISEAISKLSAGIWQTFNYDNEPISNFRETLYSEQFINDVGQWFTGFEVLGEEAGNAYLEIPKDLEPNYQKLLDNIGVLPLLEKIALNDVVSEKSALYEESFLSYPHQIHSFLNMYDFTAAGLHLASNLLDAANLISIFSGAGALLLPCGMAIEATMRTIRLLIEILVPTNLLSVEVQNQRFVWEGQEIKQLYWGHMRPKESITVGIMNWGVDLLTPILKGGTDKLLNKVLSKNSVTVKDELISETIHRIVARLPFLPALNLAEEKHLDNYFCEIKTILNMEAFEFEMSDLIDFAKIGFPPAAPLVDLTQMVFDWGENIGFIIDPKLYDPLIAGPTKETNIWYDEAFLVNYDKDVIYFNELNFPTINNPEFLPVNISAYSWTMGSIGIPFFGTTLYDVPFPESVPPVTSLIVVFEWKGDIKARKKYNAGMPDVEPYHHISSQSIFYTGLNMDAPNQEWVFKSSPETNQPRSFIAKLMDHNGVCRILNLNAKAGVEVSHGVRNPENTYTFRPLQEIVEDSYEEVPLALAPGQNELRIIATKGCGSKAPTQLWIELDMTPAINIDNSITMMADTSFSKEEYYGNLFIVYTPPGFEEN